jgi:hypothetical protein
MYSRIAAMAGLALVALFTTQTAQANSISVTADNSHVSYTINGGPTVVDVDDITVTNTTLVQDGIFLNHCV